MHLHLPTPGTTPNTNTTAHPTAQVPNKSQLFQDFKNKQEEWANIQQLSGKPITMVQLKPPKPQPQKKQAVPSDKITSFPGQARPGQHTHRPNIFTPNEKPISPYNPYA